MNPSATGATTIAATTASTLRASVGHSSLTGPRLRNEDFLGFVTPEGQVLDPKGMVLAVADAGPQG